MPRKLLTFAQAADVPGYEEALSRTYPRDSLTQIDRALKGQRGQFVLTDCTVADVADRHDNKRPIVRRFRAGVLVGESLVFEATKHGISDAMLPTRRHVVLMSKDARNWAPPTSWSGELEIEQGRIDEWKSGSPYDVTNDFRLEQAVTRAPDDAAERIFIGDDKVHAWLSNNVPAEVGVRTLTYLKAQKRSLRRRKVTAKLAA